MSVFNGTGGTNPLNFKVVGGTVSPTNPKENTIWVKTDIDIPYWTTASSVNAPAYVAKKGTVNFWWESATSSEVSGTTAAGFMPVKYKATNPPGHMRLKPINCYQNQDDTSSGWKRMIAYIYKSGSWVQFSSESVFLCDNGDPCTNIGGNWASTSGIYWDSNTTKTKAPEATWNSDNVVVTQSSYYSGFWGKENKIDLTYVSTIRFSGNLNSAINNPQYVRLQARSTNSGNSWENVGASGDIGEEAGTKNITIDTSELTGEWYVGLYLYSKVNITVYEIELIP